MNSSIFDGEPSVQRVRHDTRMRVLQVLRTERVTPRMLRVTFGGEALRGFNSAAADDHVKVFFPDRPGGEPVLPAGPPGTPLPDGAPRPVSRDYTPRRYDAAANELDIDFSLHGDGPAAAWAAQAQAGQRLGVGGPRGSFVVSGAFDWYLLIGDDTALPAIGRRLAELPAAAPVTVIAEVDDAGEQQRFDSAAPLTVQWLHRSGGAAGDPARLLRACASLPMSTGRGYTWIACESGVARALRQYLIAERGYDQRWLKAAGYWKRGASATHERIED